MIRAIVSRRPGLLAVCDTDEDLEDTLARLQKWLAPPDPLFNPRKALKIRSANTGKWYLQGARYEAWKTTGPPYTWLYGSAGSGKTILSAGIIEDLQEYCRDDPARSLVVYFFDFNDVDKQDPSKMVSLSSVNS